MITGVHLYTRGHDIVVDVERSGEHYELIRTHGALDHVTVDHYAKVAAIFRGDVPQPDGMTGRHLERILDTIRELADWLDPDRIPRRPTHADQTTTLELRAIVGFRNPATDEVTLMVRVHDPRHVLRKGYGSVEGMWQVGPREFSFDRAETAEHLATLLADDAIAIRANDESKP